MDFAFSEEQDMLRASAREFLAKECSSSYVRRVMDADGAWDEGLWKKLAEMGWTGLGIPEAHGGVGTFLDLVVILEEAGRALLPGPFFSTMGLAVPALLEAGSEAQKQEVLTRIAAGDARATVALTEPSGRWDAEGVALPAQRSGDGWRLDGVKLFVPDAAVADYTIVAARTRSGGEDGITLFLLSGRPEGVTVSPLKTMDMTRRWYEVRLDGVQVPDSAVMGAVDRGWAPLKRALDWGEAALCAEMVGGAQHVLDTSVEYAKTRHQFGKPIGIYQAVSHKLADMKLRLETSHLIVHRAAALLDADGASDLDCAMTKLHVSEALIANSLDAVQIHGGYGYMTETGLERDVRDALGGRIYSGTSELLRTVIARHLGL